MDFPEVCQTHQCIVSPDGVWMAGLTEHFLSDLRGLGQDGLVEHRDCLAACLVASQDRCDSQSLIHCANFRLDFHEKATVRSLVDKFVRLMTETVVNFRVIHLCWVCC